MGTTAWAWDHLHRLIIEDFQQQAGSSHYSSNSSSQVVVRFKARSMSSKCSTTKSGPIKTCMGSHQLNTVQGSDQATSGKCRSRKSRQCKPWQA
jgi:hypothetical protein